MTGPSSVDDVGSHGRFRPFGTVLQVPTCWFLAGSLLAVVDWK